jgi:hypothetical protein
MTSLRILYLGPRSGTCLQRAAALGRLGHDVEHVELRPMLPPTPWVDRITWKLGGHWFERFVLEGLRARVAGHRYDLAYVDGGEWVTPRVIQLLRSCAPRVINYCIDDPLGPRDGRRSSAYRKSVPHYDLCVVMRETNVAEARRYGAREVLRVFMTADEQAHAPLALSAAEREQWRSDVMFAGTWFPERGPFLLQLVAQGIPLTLYGNNWEKAPEWAQLKPFWRGSQLEGRDYVAAIQCARIALGLLSLGNRDLHTTRSTEIPAIGALLCAQRTSEHRALYVDREEALLWDDAAECAAACRWALQDEPLRARIAAAGHRRTFTNGLYNETVLTTIIERALDTEQARRA